MIKTYMPNNVIDSLYLYGIIDGKIYDTGNSTRLGHVEHAIFDSEFDPIYGVGTYFEELYRDETEFFLAEFKKIRYGENGWDFYRNITPLSEEKAKSWIKDNLDIYDYISLFGKNIKQVDGCIVGIVDYYNRNDISKDLVYIELDDATNVTKNKDANRILSDMGINIDRFPLDFEKGDKLLLFINILDKTVLAEKQSMKFIDTSECWNLTGKLGKKIYYSEKTIDMILSFVKNNIDDNLPEMHISR